MRFPLYARILTWFVLNLLWLSLAGLLLVRLQFHGTVPSFYATQAGNRLMGVGEMMADELRQTTDRNAVLHQYGQTYGVEFLLFSTDGIQLAGKATTLPAEITRSLAGMRGQGMARARGWGGPPGWARNSSGTNVAGQRSFFLRTTSPVCYWAGMCLPSLDADLRGPRRTVLLAKSASFSGGGLFFDVTLWGGVALGVFLLSALWWFPLVHGMTRAVRKMTLVAAEIARGRLESRVDVRRRDELGQLGDGINSMAQQLSDYLNHQRRFLGDIAHELCSPIARMQMALGIIEQKADPAARSQIADLREEVDQMSSLVNELLSFSKASMGGTNIQLREVSLSELVDHVINREAPNDARIVRRVASDVRVIAEPELLGRAIANVLRNALRYADTHGHIIIETALAHEQVLLTIADDGPGVPEDALPHLFDAFYRPDSARRRETGGTGLGLAIVKTCVESCKGQVLCRNRSPHGFEVVFTLRGVA